MNTIIDGLVQDNDGYWNRVVGDWSKDKFHFLARYLDAFTTAMRAKWDSLHYIDLFSGPGRCQIRGTDEVIDASPLIAAKAKFQFSRIHLCDLDQRCAESLSARLGCIPQPNQPQVLCGDANAAVHEVVKSIPADRSLSLAFLDPTGLHLHYSTVQALAARHVDLILLFPDNMDALRNWKYHYDPKPDSNLDKVLGPACDWRSRLRSCPPHRCAQVLRELYEGQLGRLRYEYRDYRRISVDGHPLYILMFCSRVRLGLEIWRKVNLIGPRGQREMDFPA